MPKKKKKAARKLDARGYVTVEPKKPQQPTTVVRSNKILQDILEELVELLDLRPVEPTPAIHDTKLTTRVGILYDTLSGYGFTNDQIERAVQALGGSSVNIPAALDYLCLWETTTSLPPLFTEGAIRDVETTTSSSSATVTVIQNQTVLSNNNNAERVVEDTRNFSSFQQASTTTDDLESQAQQQQKEWLLSQYQYETDEDRDEPNEGVEAEAMGAVAAQEHGAPLAEDQKGSINAVVESEAANEHNRPSEEETLLETLRLKLAEMEADVSNDANNYMRSKQEIIDLRNQVKILRQRVAGLERKIQKQQKEKEPKVVVEVDEEEDEETGVFDIFGASAPSPQERKPAETESQASTLLIPKDTIPESWTGKTPRQILEDYCRSNKYKLPVYKKLPLNGCKVQVHKHETTIEGSIADYRDAQYYASIKILYEMDPKLQLYRLFPGYYRHIWESWLKSAQSEHDTSKKSADQDRREVIDRLVSFIPTVGINGSLIDQDDAADQRLNQLAPKDDEWYSNPPVVRVAPKIPTSLGKTLREEFQKRQLSQEYSQMANDRRKLPIFPHRQEILRTIDVNPVTILQAETGSGKTTQCSSYILEEALSNGYGDQICILCTQPRRVAATSVAERVSDELAETGVGNLIGYQIRMETRKSSRTRLLFCTTGVVLRRLIDDPLLNGITHVVVDEVHERQWQIDLLLVTLRSLLSTRRPDLKIVLMSATLDVGMFSNFFGDAPVLKIPGRTFPVRTFYLEDILEETGHLIEEGSRVAKRDWSKRETVSLLVTNQGGTKRRETADYQMDEDVSEDFPDYSLATRRSLDRVDETVINFDLIEDILFNLLNGPRSFSPPDGGQLSTGAVLVFLPGVGEIRTLAERLEGSRFFGNRSQFDIVPMHSALSTSDHRRAFRPSQLGYRKIIIATNIAETSVTIPDVVYVIDSGRVREIQRDKRTSTRKLVVTWCSRASTEQRAGRAGRVQAGVCLKLFSSKTERETMEVATEPELRRMPLEEVCLSILAGGLATQCGEILAQTPEPPTEDAVRSALDVLQQIGAVKIEPKDNNLVSGREYLTGLGKHLAKLPVHPRVGKILIYGALFSCVDAAVTIAGFLSASKAPFDASSRDSQQAKASQATFTHPQSDFFTFLNLWSSFEEAQAAGRAREFCRENYVRFTIMNEIRDARFHFLELLCGLGFLDSSLMRKDSRSFDEIKLSQSICCRNSKSEKLVHSVIAAGLYPNIAHVDKHAPKEQTTVAYYRNEKLHVHSSVNSRLTTQPPSNWMTFFEKFGTERRVSISQTAFVSPLCILLFGSNVSVLHAEREAVIDGWIELSVAAKTGVLFREIRNELDKLLTNLIENSHLETLKTETEKSDLVLNKIVELLLTG